MFFSDMYHETMAVLESLFYHDSHPPFLALRLIQRFGISNPSPDFIRRVATAYQSGYYMLGSNTFGTGTYGDLGALVAAILLDNESRQVVLDADSSHGHVSADGIHENSVAEKNVPDTILLLYL